jgi:glycosyltransferase involved in cell wall biosynthesis
MRILLVGGIFGKPAEYRRVVTGTPETVLAEGLRARGHTVVEHGHAPPFDLHGYDVVHVHHLAAGALAAASVQPPVRMAFTGHNFRDTSRSRRVAMHYVVRRADAIVALSGAEARWQRGEFRGVAARQNVIPNGIDAAVFRFVPARMPDAGEPWRLLFVGQLERLKGVEFLLRALALLDPELEVELDLVYQVNTEEAALRRKTGQLGLKRVHFLGARSPAELAQLYATSHVFVLPSTGEALPSVISEAMFVGRPIVGTDVGAVREQVGDFGEVVAPRDSVALAAAIARVLDGYAGYARVARERSDAAALRSSVEAMVAAHERMYKWMVERPPVRSRRDKTLDRLTRVGLRTAAGPWRPRRPAGAGPVIPE